jgi:hypothetical protein|tara:strand:+ start:222 stop:689 length:468 start_codon:yes stop_codon:yes gene_type:complete
MLKLDKIFNDKNFTKDNVVADREGIMNKEYSSLGAVVKTICWSTQNRLKSQQEYISRQVNELKGLLESPYYHKDSGSDVMNDRVQRKLDFIENLQTSHDEMESFKQAIYSVHLDEFGIEYSVPVKKTATSDVNSASFLQAQEMLKQHGLNVSLKK